jgi:hypothetical protein
MKAPVVKTTAVEASAANASTMKTTAPETSAVGVSSSNADQRGEGDSDNGCHHPQFAGHRSRSLHSHSPSDFVIG